MDLARCVQNVHTFYNTRKYVLVTCHLSNLVKRRGYYFCLQVVTDGRTDGQTDTIRW